MSCGGAEAGPDDDVSAKIASHIFARFRTCVIIIINKSFDCVPSDGQRYAAIFQWTIFR